MLFSFQNITHDFNGKKLFTDIGFTMNEGSLLALRGANGSGKTTLLKILAGLIRPRYGFIFFDDFEISEDISRYHSQLNFLGHKNALDKDFTVLENLKFFAALVNRRETLDAVIKYFALEPMLGTKVKELSAGWQRRIALARLMIKKSKIWLLDEPFTNLDEDIIDITLKMIATFCDQDGIVILSSHQAIKLPFGMKMELADFKG
ncbi:MAG TPA: heme ABC exporter ATP-binding protein CcmA [Alphaproteobacteria bacterium]|nr:heme ABC exporter ATP-binding protein CcmA [Alphaproteobacteria bacterium]